MWRVKTWFNRWDYHGHGHDERSKHLRSHKSVGDYIDLSIFDFCRLSSKLLSCPCQLSLRELEMQILQQCKNWMETRFDFRTMGNMRNEVISNSRHTYAWWLHGSGSIFFWTRYTNFYVYEGEIIIWYFDDAVHI